MDAQVIKDIENKYVQTQAELQNVRAQISAKQRSIKVNEATERQLKTATNDQNTRIWQGVGKMFISTNSESYEKDLIKERKETGDSLDALSKKLRYLEQTHENLTKTITDISKKLEQST